MQPIGEFSLYFHVPFCKRKCDYCHFYVIPDQERFQSLYMDALKREWSLRSPLLPKDEKLVSIYFGGGTPSLLGSDKIDTILSWISPSDNVEITLEANPESIGVFKGINRVSLGVQSFDDSLLTMLTRTHKASKAEDAVKELAHNIKNISIDLMYDLPGQTLLTWEKTLDRALRLPIQHLSFYNLTIEPHTPFYKKRKILTPQLPDGETSLKMLEMGIEKLTSVGLKRYEISAFAKKGYQSQHNSGYWKARPFLGFGPSAFSYWEGIRWRNAPHLHRYAKALKEGRDPIDFSEKLPFLESLKEKLAIRLRLLEGVPKWPPELKDIQNFLKMEGFLDSSCLKLSNKGLLFHDSVAEIIINN